MAGGGSRAGARRGAGAEAGGCGGPAEESSSCRGGSPEPCPALGSPKLWPAPGEGREPLGRPRFGKPFELFFGQGWGSGADGSGSLRKRSWVSQRLIPPPAGLPRQAASFFEKPQNWLFRSRWVRRGCGASLPSPGRASPCPSHKPAGLGWGSAASPSFQFNPRRENARFEPPTPTRAGDGQEAAPAAGLCSLARG